MKLTTGPTWSFNTELKKKVNDNLKQDAAPLQAHVQELYLSLEKESTR